MSMLLPPAEEGDDGEGDKKQKAPGGRPVHAGDTQTSRQRLAALHIISGHVFCSLL
jgi:hypothetical protein